MYVVQRVGKQWEESVFGVVDRSAELAFPRKGEGNGGWGREGVTLEDSLRYGDQISRAKTSDGRERV